MASDSVTWRSMESEAAVVLKGSVAKAHLRSFGKGIHERRKKGIATTMEKFSDVLMA